MPDFWLDSNIFIAAKNGPYGFDIAPGFWALLDDKANQGIIASSVIVYRELVDETDDDLAEWVRQQKDSGFFIEPDQMVQATFSAVADYVQNNYEHNQAAEFLKGADPWIIAHAKTYGGRVVTNEVRVPSNSKRVKIPNVCHQFNLECINMFGMLRELGASLQ